MRENPIALMIALMFLMVTLLWAGSEIGYAVATKQMEACK